MKISCNNCEELLSKYLCDIPANWRNPIVEVICDAIRDDIKLDCEKIEDCETLTTLSAFSKVGNIISITYKDENGNSHTRTFNFESVINNLFTDVDPKCITDQDTWNTWTLEEKLQALITYRCNCCSTTTTTTLVPTTTTTTTTEPPCEPALDLAALIQYTGDGYFTFTPPGFTPVGGYIWEVIDEATPVNIYATGTLPQGHDGSMVPFTTSPNAYGIPGLKLRLYSACGTEVYVTAGIIPEVTTTTSTTTTTTIPEPTTTTTTSTTTTSTTTTSTTTTSTTTTTTCGTPECPDAYAETIDDGPNFRIHWSPENCAEMYAVYIQRQANGSTWSFVTSVGPANPGSFNWDPITGTYYTDITVTYNELYRFKVTAWRNGVETTCDWIEFQPEIPPVIGTFNLTCIGHNNCTQQGVGRLVFNFATPTPVALVIKYAACWDSLTGNGAKECYGCTDLLIPESATPAGYGCYPNNNPSFTVNIPAGVTTYTTPNLQIGFASIACQPCMWTYKHHLMQVQINQVTLNIAPPAGSTFTQIPT